MSALECRINRRNQMAIHSRFPDITQSAFLQASPNDFFDRTNRQEHKFDNTTRFYEFMDSVNAIHYWHIDINYSDIRFEPLYLRYQQSSIGCRAYDLKMRSQKPHFGRQKFQMVIG